KVLRLLGGSLHARLQGLDLDGALLRRLAQRIDRLAVPLGDHLIDQRHPVQPSRVAQVDPLTRRRERGQSQCQDKERPASEISDPSWHLCSHQKMYTRVSVVMRGQMVSRSASGTSNEPGFGPCNGPPAGGGD